MENRKLEAIIDDGYASLEAMSEFAGEAVLMRCNLHQADHLGLKLYFAGLITLQRNKDL